MEQPEKVKFEVRLENQNGAIVKNIYIGNTWLDWGINMTDYAEAMKMGPKYVRQIKADIQRHFVESVSEVLGRQVSLQEIEEAIRTGWI